jgi:hypothetical protein
MHHKLFNFEHFRLLILTFDTKGEIIIFAAGSFPASPGVVLALIPHSYILHPYC